MTWAPPGPRWDCLGRCVRKHLHAAESHVERRIREGSVRSRRALVAPPAEGATVSQGVKVECGDTAVGPEAHANPSLHAGPGTSEVGLLGARDPEHDRTVDLTGEQRRYLHDRAAVELAPESAAAVLTDHDHIFDVQVELVGEGEPSIDQALRGRVDKEPPILPVRHRGARLQTVVRERLVDDGFVENQVRFFEASLNVSRPPIPVSSSAQPPHRQHPTHRRASACCLPGRCRSLLGSI